MKQSSKLFFAIMAGMLSLSFASCDHSSDDAPSFGIDPILVDFTNSGCKEYLETDDGGENGIAVTAVSEESATGKELFVLKTDSDGKLLLTHQNAVLSCDGVILTGFRCEDATIFLTEKSTDTTNCTCNYDLAYTLNNLQEKTYNVVVERQTIDCDGKTLNEARRYCHFNFVYTPNLSETKEVNYYENK